MYSFIGSISLMIKMTNGFLPFALSLMTFCVCTLCWPLGATQYKVVASNNVTVCLT